MVKFKIITLAAVSTLIFTGCDKEERVENDIDKDIKVEDSVDEKEEKEKEEVPEKVESTYKYSETRDSELGKFIVLHSEENNQNYGILNMTRDEFDLSKLDSFCKNNFDQLEYENETSNIYYIIFDDGTGIQLALEGGQMVITHTDIDEKYYEELINVTEDSEEEYVLSVQGFFIDYKEVVFYNKQNDGYSAGNEGIDGENLLAPLLE